MSAWALGSMESQDGVSALQQALSHDDNEAVRETSAWALARSDNESSTDALAAAAESDRSARVRGTAAWAIGSLGHDDERARASLVHLLADPDHDARLKAAWALGQIGDSAAVTQISNALAREKNADVQRALLRALTKSGGASTQAMSEMVESRDPSVREAAVRALAGARSFNPWPWPWPRPRPWP